jgi:hypothetical protein
MAHQHAALRSKTQATAALAVIVPMSLGAVSPAPIYSCRGRLAARAGRDKI